MQDSNTQEKSHNSEKFDEYNKKYTIYRFYEGQYKKRAFIKDHFFELEQYQEKYNILYNHIRDASFKYSLIDECDDFIPILNEHQTIISRIEQLQLYYLYKKDNKFKYICKNMIDCIEFCDYFFERYDNSIIETVNSTSSKYGLFITDLISKIDEITIEDTEDIYKKYKLYNPYPDDTMMDSYLKNTYLNIESKIQSKRFYDGISKLASGDNEQILDIEKYNINKYMKGSSAIKEFRCSEKKRNLGLFMWDNHCSPMNKKQTLIQILMEIKRVNKKSMETEFTDTYVRIMKRLLKNTIDSINAHHVIPIKS